MAFRRDKRTQEGKEGEASTSATSAPLESPPPAKGTETGSARPTTVGDDAARAATAAGDPAAAGTDSEGPGAEAGGFGGAPEVAASPDPAYVPAAEPVRESVASGDDPTTPAPASLGTAADRAGALVEQRPELLVAGAFAGGLVLARVIAALGGRR